MEKQERDQLLNKISTLKEIRQRLDKLDDHNERHVVYGKMLDETYELCARFHKLFDSYILRHHLKRMLKLNYDLIIGPLILERHGNHHGNPQHVVNCLDQLLEIDRLLKEYKMEYLFHFEECFDEGENYILYLGSQELVKEWWELFDDYTENREYKPFMYIPPFLRYGASFLEKHKDNPGLIQIWASSF